MKRKMNKKGKRRREGKREFVLVYISYTQPTLIVIPDSTTTKETAHSCVCVRDEIK